MNVRRAIRRYLRSAWRRLTFEELSVLARIIGARKATMLDVGGHFGAVAEIFLDKGWTVHSLEPDPENRHRLARLLDSFPETFHLHALAASDRPGELLPFFQSSVSTGISSVHAFHESHEFACDVETTTVSTIIDSFGLADVGLLKIDVEGHEPQVLRGVDWHRHRPKVVAVEFDAAKSEELAATAIDRLLAEQGYETVICEWEPVTAYGGFHRPLTIRRDPALVSTRSWGNVVGFLNGDDAQAYTQAAMRSVKIARLAHPLTRRIDGLRRRRVKIANTRR